MIFLTVGTQLPFDRLVHSVDHWATTHPAVIFAQIADSKNPPKTIHWANFLSPAETKCHMERAEIIVAHAGMGSILTALSMGKRIIVMPRRASLEEHRNDHQLASAGKLRNIRGLTVAENTRDLVDALDFHLGKAPVEAIRQIASQELIANLKNWIGG